MLSRLGTGACLVCVCLVLGTPSVRADEGLGHSRLDTRSVGVGVLEAIAAPKAGAVTLGQVASGAATACTPGPTTMVQYVEGGTPTYVAPTAGVITSYSVRAGANGGLARLVVLGTSPTAGHRLVVALSAQNAVVVNTVNTFATRVPIAAGSSIGLNNSANAMVC